MTTNIEKEIKKSYTSPELHELADTESTEASGSGNTDGSFQS